jgi:hypothetical protein
MFSRISKRRIALKRSRHIVDNRPHVPIPPAIEPLEGRQLLTAFFLHSEDVVIIGGPSVINGGYLPTDNSSPDLSFINKFDTLAPANVTSTALAGYDTAVINVASWDFYDGSTGFSTDFLPQIGKDALIDFVGTGHKLIIYDSECQHWDPVTWEVTGMDYSWLPYPFTTNNPGAMGATGTLTVVEENTLSSKYPTGAPYSAYYIDAGALSSDTDAVGDSNVLTTLDAHWKVDMVATNTNGVSGPVHVYAEYSQGTDNGLIIYNGLDMDYIDYYDPANGLRKIWVQEVGEPFNPSGLPSSVSVVGINLAGGTGEVGTTATVVATLTDLLANPQSGITVNFAILSGPNAGITDAGITDSDGQVILSYTGLTVGTDVIEASFTNSNGQVITTQANWVWTQSANQPPTVDPGGPYTVDEGSSVTLAATIQDPDNDPMTCTWDLNNDGVYETAGESVTFTGVDGPATQTVGVRVEDDHQHAVFSTTTITVNNVAPIVTITGPAAESRYAIGAPVSLSGAFTDPGILDTHTAQWQITSAIAGTVTETAGCGTVANTVTFSQAGIYHISLTVTDKDGGSGSASTVAGQDAYIIVYDPNKFVTAGGTYASNKCNFGFNAMYQLGASIPTGQTEFQFNKPGLTKQNLHSVSYDWLIISGNQAQYQGTGTINGTGNYGFLITVIDGQKSPDKFSIRIWDKNKGNALVYDSGWVVVANGSITIHTITR